MKDRKTIIILAVFIFLCAIGNCLAQPVRYIRVNILADAAAVRFSAEGFYEVLDFSTGRVLYRGKNLKTTVTSSKDGILVGKMHFDTPKLLVRVSDCDVVAVDERNFKGQIAFVKKSNLHLALINYIDLEDYIKGVLYHEASHYWPEEALKSQAIVCRTFALYQVQENTAKDFDVTSDIYSQVYGGKTSERYRTNKIVDETKGQVLLYKNRIFPSYYHSTCAGHTEDASLLWNTDIAPLKGVSCGFCQDSPHFKWHFVLPEKEIREKLLQAGYQAGGRIKEILVLGRDKSQRATKLRIVTEKKDLEIPVKDFRNIVGPNIIRSANFKVEMANSDAVFLGLGWGHGVGLCQWGAYFMAKQGATFEQILKYYYPGSSVSPKP